MDFKAIERELELTKQGLATITDLSLETEEATDNLVKRMAKLSGISTKGGILRSIVTRGLVAFPTGYRIAQQASSALLLFRYLDQTRKERLKEEKEFNELMQRRESILKKVQQLDKENLSFQEREAILTDASVKSKVKLLGVEGAIRQAREDLMKSSKKIRKTGRLAMRGQAARFMQNPDGESRDFETFGIMGRRGAMAEESLDIITAKLQEREIFSFNDRIKGMTKQIDTATFSAEKLKREIEGNDKIMKNINLLQKEIEKIEKTKRSDVGTDEYIAIMRDMQRITKMLDEGDLLKLTGGGSLESLRKQAVALKLSTDQMNELEGLFTQMMGMQDEAEQQRNLRRRELIKEKRANEMRLMGSETLREKRKERDLALSILDRLERQQENLTEEQVFLIKELQETVKGINEQFGTPDNPVLRMGNALTRRRIAKGMSETDALKKDVEQGTQLITGVNQLGFFEKLKLKGARRREKARKNLVRLVALMNKKLSGTYIKLMLRVAGMALSVFSWFLGSIFMIAGLVFLLHQSGFFTNTLKYFEKFQKVIPTIEIFMEGIFDFFGGLFNTVVGLFEILIALFTGDDKKLMDSLDKFLNDGLAKVVLGIGKIFFSVSMTVAGLVVSALAGLVSGIMGDAKSGAGKVGGFLGGIAGAVGGAKVGAILGSAFGPVGTVVGYAAGGYLGSKLGGHVGVKTGDFLAGEGNMNVNVGSPQPAMGFSMGGITPYSGTFLVGERGPELVSLPGNSRVYNNTDTSRMMSPTININVTGRIGASETELNDIARKIGQKINIEMNRYSSSGLRG